MISNVFQYAFFLKSIRNTVCVYIYLYKTEIKCNLKLSLNNQTFVGKISAICPSLFYKRKNGLSIAAVQIWIKTHTLSLKKK